ncbi:MAG TPA: hypothetical protein VFV91_11815 [Gaiellaceae bacterium]|jgi:hypothetical protein|nr:hypothetical protein [Gaiellaceae bacterium]
MRRLVGWFGGALGGITAYRLLRRRPQASPAEPDDRADELRAKLAESRASEPVVEEPVVEEPAPEPEAEAAPEPEPPAPEERRRQVHEEGRAALDEMRPE